MKKYCYLFVLFIFSLPSFTQEIIEVPFVYSAEHEFRRMEKTNLSPYAMFGDNTITMMTAHERNSDYDLKIPVIDLKGFPGEFCLNMRTGKATVLDNEGFVIYEEIFPMDARARFLTIDPMAEKYYSISPYVYCANNPLKFVDPDGREISFSFDYEKDKDGNYVLDKYGNKNITSITMNVTGKVLNMSNGGEIDVNEATGRIIAQLEASFSGDLDGVSFTTRANLTVASSMNDVAENDHLFVLADISSHKGKTPNGVANQLGGKVAFISADYFRGPWDTTIGNLGPAVAAHEFGHLANLKHSPKGLMRAAFKNSFYTSSTDVQPSQLQQIVNSESSLNQGNNYELVPSRTKWGTGMIKKTHRGREGIRYINY
ncbi:MAG: hypothetical protein LUG18_08165 [Candidatus Azobacteroides sp.]|nr:hypothetical protein [Candidatus Azobacteroides sp.]